MKLTIVESPNKRKIAKQTLVKCDSALTRSVLLGYTQERQKPAACAGLCVRQIAF